MSQPELNAGDGELRLSPYMTRRLRNRIPSLIDRVAYRVQAEIAADGRCVSAKRRHPIAAATEAASGFLRLLSEPGTDPDTIEGLLKRAGYDEGRAGRGRADLNRALRIAAREVWLVLTEVSDGAGATAATLGRLGDELSDYLDQLTQSAHAGHAMGLAAREADPGLNREHLIDALLDGGSPADIRSYASLSGWTTPTQMVVIAATTTEPGAAVTWPAPDRFDRRVLIRANPAPGHATIFLAPADQRDEILAILDVVRGTDPALVRIAHSWPVPPAEASHAHRWVTRALRLASTGLIPDRPVIDCADHRIELWLHSEPELRRLLAKELVRPLRYEYPSTRKALAATLLAWLEVRGNAPTLAAALGVHPQTVRYRWRRLNELLGRDNLADPDYVLAMTLVLKASLPLWEAGDQSDWDWTDPEP